MSLVYDPVVALVCVHFWKDKLLLVYRFFGGWLQMDRHKYVKVAFHGFQKLTREERQATYGSTLSRESYDEPDYALIDTLFSLAEAYLFMQLVDFRDQFPGKIPSGTE